MGVEFKVQIFDNRGEAIIAQGLVGRISQQESSIKVKYKVDFTGTVSDHTAALSFIFKQLIKLGIISKLDEICAVGHRGVAGGKYFDHSVIVTEKVMNKIDKLSELAPIHNPANLKEIKIFKRLLPNAIEIAAFIILFQRKTLYTVFLMNGIQNIMYDVMVHMGLVISILQ